MGIRCKPRGLAWRACKEEAGNGASFHARTLIPQLAAQESAIIFLLMLRRAALAVEGLGSIGVQDVGHESTAQEFTAPNLHFQQLHGAVTSTSDLPQGLAWLVAVGRVHAVHGRRPSLRV